MLILSRKKNESINIGSQIEVSIVDIRGDHVRLGISAPHTVAIHRKEIYEAIQKENRAAAASPSSEAHLPPLDSS